MLGFITPPLFLFFFFFFLFFLLPPNVNSSDNIQCYNHTYQDDNNHNNNNDSSSSSSIILIGYVCEPKSNNNNNNNKTTTLNHPTIPAIVIIHDINGITFYERKRAQMITKELGYIAFVADIYGRDEGSSEYYNNDDMTRRYYETENFTTYLERMKLAVMETKAMTSVDPAAVAMIGYSFGGRGVMGYAFSGLNDVAAIVTFHGGFRSADFHHQPFEANDDDTAIVPKIMIQSGSDDDTGESIQYLEDRLNARNATWQITRYSDVQNAFTVWNDDSRYDERADIRSWNAMKFFLQELFHELEYQTNQPNYNSLHHVQPLDYDDFGFPLRGFVAKPKGASDINQVPAVVIIPDWNGPDHYEHARATMLADLGYLALAADIYGPWFSQNNKKPTLDQILNSSTYYRTNLNLFLSRIHAGVNAVKSMSIVNPNKVAIIGYCFGGTGVISYVLAGNENNNNDGGVVAAVSFHGGLRSLQYPKKNISMGIPLLIESGGADDTSTTIAELEQGLHDGNATWEISRYSNVVHSFTNFYAKSSKYNLRADAQSWVSMQSHLDAAFMAVVDNNKEEEMSS